MAIVLRALDGTAFVHLVLVFLKMLYNAPMTRKIGLLGGTFDPIHYGHLALAEDVRAALGLDQLVFIPAAQQPFKRGQRVTPAHQRLEMLRLACAGNPHFAISTIELDRAGVSYTAVTLEALHRQQLGELFFLVGADTLMDMPRWYLAGQIAQYATVVGVQRPGVALDATRLLAQMPSLAGRLQVHPGPDMNVSSTELRERVASGRSIRYFTPDSVVEYIQVQGLYR